MIIRRCVLESEQCKILNECHASPYGGHFSREKTAHKILKSGFYWPTIFKDYAEWVKLCDRCQNIGNISSRNEMSMQGILVMPFPPICLATNMGNRFYGTLPTIIWKLVHTAGSGLCVQVGGSNSLSKE